MAVWGNLLAFAVTILLFGATLRSGRRRRSGARSSIRTER